MTPSMPLVQIALSTTDLLRSHFWYERVFGLAAAGERRHREGALWAEVPGLPEASFTVWCLVDQQDFFQLEMFEFDRPRVRRTPADWRRSDLGYSSIGLHVDDFDAALERVLVIGGRPLTAPIGATGERRVCLLDPDGVLLELMEDDPRPPNAPRRPRTNLPTAARSISLSVRDLRRARRFWIETLGCVEATGVTLHRAEHEALWGLAGAECETSLVWAGDFLVELVQYASPVARPRPAGYLLSDQGILNIALGTTDKAAFDVLYRRVVDAGYRSNRAPFTAPDVATVVYLNDDQGFSVELLHIEPGAKGQMGFLPTPPK